MAGSRDSRPVEALQATVEEYHSSNDSDHEGSATVRRSPAAPGQANVATKRSHPSNLGTDKSPVLEKVVNIDVQSDSGYSSHTAATMSSADSGPSAKAQSPPSSTHASAAPVPPASPAVKRRPTLSQQGDERQSSHSSPRKPLARSGSVSTRNSTRPAARERRPTATAPPSEDCTDPTCTKCVPPVRGRRPKPSPLDSGLDISYPPFDQQSHRSDPAPTTSSYSVPQSPQQPNNYMRGPAVVQPGQTRGRRSSSMARPVSFAGDAPQNYWVPGMMGYPSPPQDQYGPPPAMSAYAMHHPQLNAYGMAGAYPPQMQQTSPPYDNMQLQRPGMPTRNSTSNNFNARRPTSQIYGPPLLTQEAPAAENMPSARYPPNAPASATRNNFPQIRNEPEPETSDSEYSSEEENGRALMPPPKMMPPPKKPSTQRRPSIVRQPNSYKAERPERPERRMSLMSQSVTLDPPRDRERDPRASRSSTTTRAPSRARPALVQLPKAQSAFETGRSAEVMIENSRSRRRQSYQPDQAFEKQYVRETGRRPKEYHNDGAAVASSGHRRRKTDVTFEEPDDLQHVADDVEAYLQRTRGSDIPLNDHIHRAAKRASRVPSGPSESSHSNDKATHVSRRTTATSATQSGEIRLRVDASAPLSLQFNGDMEGRTLRLEPGEDGMADIVIGNANGTENTYRSERGSVYGASKKSLVSSRAERPERTRRDTTDDEYDSIRRSERARRDDDDDRIQRPERYDEDDHIRRPERSRRDVEVESMRSAHSSQIRRERDRDPRTLRRKAEIRYD